MEALRYQGAEVVAEELEALRQRIIANMDAAGQRASGATANSLTPEVTEGSAGITGILWGRSFFSTLEKGSRPWKRQYIRPPKFFIDLMAEWAAIGHVPFKEKDKLRKQYQTALDSHFKRWNMKETRNRLDAFSNTVEELASSDQAQNKLYRERERLMRAYEGLKNNLQTYQNNMGFLNVSSKSGNKMIEDLERKIEKLKDDMQLIAQKIGLIDEKLQ